MNPDVLASLMQTFRPPAKLGFTAKKKKHFLQRHDVAGDDSGEMGMIVFFLNGLLATGIYVVTLWSFNIAMENGPFIDGLPIKNCDFRFSMAILNNQVVIHVNSGY